MRNKIRYNLFLILSITVFGLSYGQNFFNQQEKDSSVIANDYGIYDGLKSPELPTEPTFFEQINNPYDNPDYGVDGPGNPSDPSPIDNWLFILPIAGILVAGYFLRKRKIALN